MEITRLIFLTLLSLAFNSVGYNAVGLQVYGDKASSVTSLLPAYHQLVPGQVVSFRTSGKYGITYHVYTPINFKPDTLPPMVVAFSPGGKGEGVLQSFKDAAEQMGWIGVGCDTLRNNMGDYTTELEIEDELLDDILNTIPHNVQQVYLSGVSGGAMRAYGITVRRSEKFAGIIAHGGWLGGLEYQDKLYPEGMSIAMLNGNLDMGAGGWTIKDTKTLENRKCVVKHFTCLGGHIVAPASVTLIAMKWLEEQWNKQGLPNDSKIPLKILFIGNNIDRTEGYRSFLEQYFSSVKTVHSDSVSLDMTNEADILVLDDAVYSLPDNYNKAMLLIGAAGLLTGQRYGSNIKVESNGCCAYLLDPDTTRTVFKTPFIIQPYFQKKQFPGDKPQILVWQMDKMPPSFSASSNTNKDYLSDMGVLFNPLKYNYQQSKSMNVILADTINFSGSVDSEVVLKAITNEGNQGAIVLREASRLFWGDSSAPDNMTAEYQNLFVNALVWIHGFDGLRQSVYLGLTSRDSIHSIISRVSLNSREALRWFPEDILKTCVYDKQKLNQYYLERNPFIFTNYGSGQFQVDTIAQNLKTPNADLTSIQTWISMLDGSDRKFAMGLLIRYTNLFLHDAKAWQEWFDKNRGNLTFSDEAGYSFHVKNLENKTTAE